LDGFLSAVRVRNFKVGPAPGTCTGLDDVKPSDTAFGRHWRWAMPNGCWSDAAQQAL